jgi:pimeloyl-ACP methyl ester carboxylesterase
MRRLVVPAAPGKVAPRRIVLLPGAYQEPEDYVTAGFAEAVQQRGMALDLEFVAPELGHLLDRSVLDTLDADVIAPARSAGCRELWLGGASLGGFIAMLYAEQRMAQLDGLCLFAPYLGNRAMTGEIARAGGLQNWEPAGIAANDEERRIWAWIRNAPAAWPRIHLGFGRQDRFGHGHGLFAAALGEAAVDTVDGGHDWPTWLRLWERFLDRLGVR